MARLTPTSSLTTLPPVSTAMSCSIALRRSPKPGAFTAQVLIVPRKVLMTSVASASLSMSSAITSSGRPALTTSSSSGSRSFSDDRRLSHSRIAASSSTHSWRSALLMKYGDSRPWSNCSPSTTDSSLSSPEPSSIVMAPSRPTFSIACASNSPMERSLLAEMAATWAISCDVVQGRASRLSSATTVSTARSMPRLRSIGFMPAAR